MQLVLPLVQIKYLSWLSFSYWWTVENKILKKLTGESPEQMDLLPVQIMYLLWYSFKACWAIGIVIEKADLPSSDRFAFLQIKCLFWSVSFQININKADLLNQLVVCRLIISGKYVYPFYSMQHKIALPLSHHACISKLKRVSHLGLVFKGRMETHSKCEMV